MNEITKETRRGYGNIKEILEIVNADGSLIYRVRRVVRCVWLEDDCQYCLDPWLEYGRYDGNAMPDPELIEALETKRKLERKFRF